MSELFLIQCDGCGRDATGAPQLLNSKARVRVPPGWASVWVSDRGDAHIAHFCSPDCWIDATAKAS